MVPQNQLIAFTLDERRFAISLDSVLRVIPALEVTFLPQAPRYVVGAINVEGRIFQVLNVRKMCGVPERDIEADDQFILIHASGRFCALPVDGTAVIECDPSTLAPADTLHGQTALLRGALRCPDGLILLCQVDGLLKAAYGREIAGVLA